jgi:hypothetical protein
MKAPQPLKPSPTATRPPSVPPSSSSGNGNGNGNGNGERERLINGEKKDPIFYGDNEQDDGSNKDKDEEDSKASTLVYAFVLMLFFQLGNRIFGRLQTFPMHNYPLFMNMLSVFIYIPASFAYILPMQHFYPEVITKEQQEIPKYKFGIMGIYDSIAGIMQTFAVNYITNSGTIVLVQQSAIPISMVISKISLQAQYTYAQYVGAAVVLLGIMVVLIPDLMPAAPGTHTDDSADANATSKMELMWIFIMVISCIPMCLSSVYKEKALGETEIDVVYLNGWVAIFQFLVAIPLCIPTAYATGLGLSDIMPNMWNGAKCWVGINTIMEADEARGIWKDDCAMAPVFVNTYLGFNLVFNVLIIVILKHGSANILWMASTVIVPLSNIAFSLNFMPNHKPLTGWDVAGLVVIMAGLVVYRFMSQLRQFYYKVTCQTYEEEEEETEASRKVSMKAERGSARFMGLNQLEALNSLIDTRVMKARQLPLYRSAEQIRGNYLLKIGVQPSPMVMMSPASRGVGRTSPAIQINPMVRTLSLTRKNTGTTPGAGTGAVPSTGPGSGMIVGNIPNRDGSSSNGAGVAGGKKKGSEV